MNNHYYTENPDIVHDEKTWSFNLLNNEIKFTTDNGVFSKQTVDYGTRVMLEAFREDHAPVGKILDLGTGYGPVGISLALAYPKRSIDMVDVNNLALSLAQRNATNNHVADQVKVFHSNVYEDVTDKYAAILTNPPVRAGKEIVQAMISDAAQHLVAAGTLTVVLQKKQGAPSAKKLMEEVFGNCEIIRKDKGYYILEAVKA
ncbi:class I SAM-dependent methyltransferase [Periweissella fabaria]|uniref:Ribosomal RNA small subunit methyltransferase C n=1 Tax=Periweissella fabaria TaxID=546157 RepID=A0ABN8BLB6_9LACO|nr:class I SAM-dependent methyltransferase [Periweissella fabaria]MCM0597978.1 class I SAM-dependent methyltransferase [Periweissella fabaria]CAH0417421.1 Ribosomal RNA small subunit methyltransferase C [Periweissella fabaria]